jgi:hypothetical protein
VTTLPCKLAFALFPLLMLATPIYAQVIDRSLCEQCLAISKAELTKCLEAAISQEDKRSCYEKQETHVKSCESECKIARETEAAIIRESAPTKQILENR